MHLLSSNFGLTFCKSLAPCTSISASDLSLDTWEMQRVVMTEPPGLNLMMSMGIVKCTVLVQTYNAVHWP